MKDIIKIKDLINKYLAKKISFITFEESFRSMFKDYCKEFSEKNAKMISIFEDIHDDLGWVEENPFLRQDSKDYISEEKFRAKLIKNYTKIEEMEKNKNYNKNDQQHK